MPPCLHRLVVGVWVQYRKPCRQLLRIRQLPIEIDNPLRHRQMCLVVVGHIIIICAMCLFSPMQSYENYVIVRKWL